MRALVYAGWLMIGVGAAIAVGSAASGVGGGIAFGALMLAALGGSGAFMIWVGRGWDRPLESAQDLHRYGRPANATVRKLEDARLDAHGTRTAKLTVHVTPRNERAYKATRRVALPGGRIPAVEETVTVKFDPNSRREFVLLSDTYEVRDGVQVAGEQMAAATEMCKGLAQPPRS
jgi:hypothetical protein